MIRCLRFRRYEKNTLKGFPARSYTDKDGNTQWQALIEFAEGAKEAREQFRKQALDAIHAATELTGTANSDDAP